MLGGVAVATLPSSLSRAGSLDASVMTVAGRVPADALGRTLCHEHILVDFIGAKETGYHRWDRHEVIRVVEPKLKAILDAGFDTLIECTPACLGRDPELLLALSERTGLHIVTNTGYYGARQNKFLPPHAFEATADELAALWIAEYNDGIDGTGVRPGFIKIGLDEGTLSLMHRKLVRAAAITSRATGLAIASHTGTATGAFEALEILAVEHMPASAFVWVHAQAEPDIQRCIEAATRGCWISLDGIQDDNIDEYLEKVLAIRAAGLMDKVLISQDAGWYSPGEKDGSVFRSYLSIAEKFLPALREKGVTEDEITQLLEGNVGKAFGR